MSNGTEDLLIDQDLGRERNAVLEAIELMRAASLDTFPVAVAFLYLCENEGLCVSELADLTGMNMAAASRAGAALTGRTGDDTGLPLAHAERMGRLRTLSLTEAGRTLRTRIDAAIARATPVQLP